MSDRIIQMLNKLNYYSRYNRIKNPKDIRSLYHLMEGLNLDSVLTDDLVLRVSNIHSMHMMQRHHSAKTENQNAESAKFTYKNSGNHHDQIQSQQFQISSANRRYVSLGKPASAKDNNNQHNIRINYAINTSTKLKPTAQNQNKPIINGGTQNKSEIEGEKAENSLQSGQNRANSHQQSRNRTNNLQAMNCLETQSIPNSANSANSSSGSINSDAAEEDGRASSPIHAMNNQDVDLRYESEKNIKKMPKVCQSELFQTNRSNKNKIMNNERSINIDDQFSEGLAQLNKVDQIRNSSYHNKINQQIDGLNESKGQDYDGTRSQKLFRLHGSDIQMEDRQNYDNQEYGNAQLIMIQESEIKQNIDIPNMRRAEEQQEDSYYDQQETEARRQYVPHKFNQTSESDDDRDYDSEEEMRMKQQLASIDNRLSSPNQLPRFADGEFKRIPSKGLSEGKWPLGGTQQSIECGNSHQISPFPSTMINKPPQVNASNITQKERKPFKKCILDKKLNPRLVSSTIVNDGPVKKVNFKKMLKKDSIQNKQRVQKSPECKKTKPEKLVEQNKELLKAFFDLN